MDTLKKATFPAIVALVVAIGYGYFFSSNTIIRETVDSALGAIPGNEISGNYLSVGGVTTASFKLGLNKASTTICSIQSPPNATSTLRFGSVKIDTATTTAIAVEIGKDSSNLTATTTRLGYKVLGSFEKVTLLALTSTSSALLVGPEPDFVFAPSSWFVVKYGGAVGSLNTLVGSCEAQFIVN